MQPLTTSNLSYNEHVDFPDGVERPMAMIRVVLADDHAVVRIDC